MGMFDTVIAKCDVCGLRMEATICLGEKCHCVDVAKHCMSEAKLSAVQECYKAIDVASDEILRHQAGAAAVAARMLNAVKSIEARMRERKDV